MHKRETPRKLFMTYEYVISVESHADIENSEDCNILIHLLDIVRRLLASRIVLYVVAINDGTLRASTICKRNKCPTRS